MAQAVFDEFRKNNYPTLDVGPAFERFASSLVLRPHDVTSGEMEVGIVGDTDDGGIDGFHIIIGGNEAVTSSSPYLSRRRDPLRGLTANVNIDVHIVQAKSEKSWDSNVLPKIGSALDYVLNDSKKTSHLREFPLNADVIETALALRKLRERTAKLIPQIRFHVSYVTLADEANMTPYFATKKRQLKAQLAGLLPSSAQVEVNYYGAGGIIKLESVTTEYTSRLKFARHPSRVSRSLVGLASVNEYLKFLRDPKTGKLRQELFAANVRDYAGSNVRVNGAISKTLSSDNKTQFWWLNNGITLVVDSAVDPVENEWVFTNPLIVNGLQTSHVIEEVSRNGELTRSRGRDLVVVRVITAPNADAREEVIAGTNNQSAISGLQLHANEEKLVRIEQYLRSDKWYLERRRHQFRGQSLPAGRIKSIVDVAQAIMSYKLLTPDSARARPTDILTKSSAGWDSVFGGGIPESTYTEALNFMELVNGYLGTANAKSISDEMANTRYYMASGAALKASGVGSVEDYLKLPPHALPKKVKDSTLEEVLKALSSEVQRVDDGSKSRDRIYKSSALKEAFFSRLLDG